MSIDISIGSKIAISHCATGATGATDATDATGAPGATARTVLRTLPTPQSSLSTWQLNNDIVFSCQRSTQ